MVPGDGSASASSSSGSTETKAPINLLLNPERNTGYNGTHIWKAIYEENCLAAGDMCLEERVLYRLLSGLHSSTTLSIAYHYYPPSKSKNRTRWEPNPTYFMRQFEDHPDRLRNLHFAYVVLLRAVRKAAPFLTRYEIRTGNIVEDETARVLLRRLLDSAVLKSCSQVFNAFDESLLWKSKDIKLRQDFKGVFRNVSAILDCVQCQQCKLHGKLTMLGYGAALKVLFMQQPVLERNEIVALINTIAKFSESLKHIRELTNLYWRSNVGTSVGGSGPGCTPPSATRNLPSAPLSGWPASTAGSMTDWVDRAVQSVADLGRHGRIDWQREAELVQLALQKNEDLLILSKHYGADLEKFLDLTTRMIRGGGIGHPTSLDPDAVIVGSGLAGLTAALNILDRGGRVVILEKEHLLGGNSNKASSGINGCCLPNEVAETRDTLETFRNDTTRSAGKSAQPELIDTLVTRSAPALTWLKTRVGVDLSLLSQLGGHATKRTHRPSNGMAGAEIMYHLSKAIREYEASGHAQILVDVKVTDLLTNDATSDNEGPGRVVGVKAQFLKNGSVAEIRAENVVLATGGFAADRSKGSYLERYRPELLSMPATAGAFSTGDGVSLATSLGAGTVDMDKVQIHPTGWVDPSDPKNLSKMLAAELMRGVGGILLNSKGERFCNELGTRAYVVEQMLSHDPTYAKTKKWDTKSVIPTFHLVLSSSAATDGKKHVDLYIHKGLMTEVSGVSGLAKHTGIPKATLLRTIQRYQQDASHGTDDFGKTSFRGVPAKDLESEVFYAGKITPVLHYCMGGITIDNEGNVLNENGDIIPGLHAAGEVTGGVHGENRLGGNSLLECTVFGTIIGQKLPIKTMPAMSSTLPPSQDMPSDKMLSRTLPSVTVSELGQHNTPEDCWVAINDVVYDLTSFADEHPAGSASIHELAGKDGTEAFAAVHNENILDEFKDARIGRLVVS
jgi:flavocytochrome c